MLTNVEDWSGGSTLCCLSSGPTVFVRASGTATVGPGQGSQFKSIEHVIARQITTWHCVAQPLT